MSGGQCIDIVPQISMSAIMNTTSTQLRRDCTPAEMNESASRTDTSLLLLSRRVPPSLSVSLSESSSSSSSSSSPPQQKSTRTPVVVDWPRKNSSLLNDSRRCFMPSLLSRGAGSSSASSSMLAKGSSSSSESKKRGRGMGGS